MILFDKMLKIVWFSRITIGKKMCQSLRVNLARFAHNWNDAVELRNIESG
jgi:hypothetical protein